jgi:hypothetical protein
VTPQPLIGRKEPWKSPVDWLTLSIIPEQRLNELCKKLVGYSLLTACSSELATEFGIKLSR